MIWEPVLRALWFWFNVVAAICAFGVVVYAWFRAVRWVVRRLP